MKELAPIEKEWGNDSLYNPITRNNQKRYRQYLEKYREKGRRRIRKEIE
jgi:hypothetical protein